MITALLILALIVATLGTVSIVGWCLGQGFWFWLLAGNEVFKVCIAGIFGLLSVIFDANNG